MMADSVVVRMARSSAAGRGGRDIVDADGGSPVHRGEGLGSAFLV